VSFLQTRVDLLTLDIGAKHIDNCISVTGIDMTCVKDGPTSVATNPPRATAELRNAAGPYTLIVAMNYYDFPCPRGKPDRAGPGAGCCITSGDEGPNDIPERAYRCRHSSRCRERHHRDSTPVPYKF